MLIFLSGKLYAQNYSAIHGSNYSGSLGVYNNPSSIVVSPFKWDLTLGAFQFQTITNALKGPNFPFNLSSNATFFTANGNFPRMADVNFNMRLLNGRYSIDNKQAFAFGLNIRGYTLANTGKLNYTDSIQGPRSFLFLNEANRVLDLNSSGSTWLEVYGSYALTVVDGETGRLNAGASIKLMRGMGGAFVKMNNVGVVREELNDQAIYKIAQGDARYGYSSNFVDGSSFQAGDLFSGSKTGFAIDLGVQYLVRSQAVGSIYDEVDENDYEWKIGFSLLDLGWNNFNYGPESRAVASLIEDVSSSVLHDKFSRIGDLGSFNDSLSTIVNSAEALTGTFKIFNPARAVLNVDRYISGNVFVNAELSVNLFPGTGNNIAVKEGKLLTVTPRWESRKIGVYAPVQVTRHGNFWIGGAVKLGPLLMGTHNLLNAFSKNKNLSGGGYLALTIRPFHLVKEARNRQYECPDY